MRVYGKETRWAPCFWPYARRLPAAAEEPDLIFRKSTVWKFLTPDDKLAVYGIDDPMVEGVACHYTVPEKGGIKGAFGLAEQVSDISLACRQIGPIKFKAKVEQGGVVIRESRSFFFKKMQIVRGCDGEAERARLSRLFRQADRRKPEELDLHRANHALGRCDGGAEMRGVPDEVAATFAAQVMTKACSPPARPVEAVVSSLAAPR